MILITGYLAVLPVHAAEADKPAMLPRELITRVTLVEDGAARAVIVAPDSESYLEAATRIQDRIQALTGAAVPIRRPEEVVEKRGLVYKPHVTRRNLILLGTPMNNDALLWPYLRARIAWAPPGSGGRGLNPATPEQWQQPGAFVFQVVPNVWAGGTGLVFVGASDPEGLGKATEAFLQAVEKERLAETISLNRVLTPVEDKTPVRVRYWKTVWLPRWKKYLEKPDYHVSYSVTPLLYGFTLDADSGLYTTEEVNESEAVLLDYIIAYSRHVWSWPRSGPGYVGGRHPLFKNLPCLLVMEHLLTHGRPNAAAKKVLEKLVADLRAYYRYVIAHTYHTGEDDEACQAWQSAIWFALLTGDLKYFESGHAHDAAMRTFLMSDNLTQMAANSPYDEVLNINKKVTARAVLSTAAWGNRDGRWKWLLENMPWHNEYPYFSMGPLALPLDDVKPVRPDEWLGVRALSVSEHDYKTVTGIPRDKTALMIALRDSFEPAGQYLAVDGFRTQAQKRDVPSPNSILRYTDHGRTFLMGFTGKEGNYYHSGVHVGRGVVTQEPGSTVRLDVAATLKDLGFVSSTVPDYAGTEWTRNIFWKRGEYFLFLDRVTAQEDGKYRVTVTWRTHSPLRPIEDGWRQRQEDVSFFIKPASALAQRYGREPPESYGNETVPYVLRQSLPFEARTGDTVEAANLLYSTKGDGATSLRPERIGAGLCRIVGKELAVVGLSGAKDIETDAEMFFLSTRTVAIASGTYLKVNGQTVVSQKENGDVEADVPKDLQGIVQEWITGLKPKIHAPSDVAHAAEAVPLKPAWSVSLGLERNVSRHADRVQASDDQTLRTQFFDPPVDLKEIVLIERQGKKIEDAQVTFSDDEFRNDRRVATGPDRETSRIIGPVGKSFFSRVNVRAVPGQKAGAVRISVTPADALDKVEFITTAREPQPVKRVETVRFDDAGPVILVQSGDNDVAAISPSGKRLWSHRFDARLISWEVLKWKGARRLIAVDAAGMFHLIGSDGAVVEQPRRIAGDSSGLYRLNSVYSMGVWPGSTAKPASLVLGTYQAVAWLGEDGMIDGEPDKPAASVLPYGMRGYMWIPLQYLSFCLPEAIDLNRDGTVDQVFLTRAFARAARLEFLDGRTRKSYSSQELPKGQPLALKLIGSTDKAPDILAANESFMGLYSAAGSERWSVRLDLPASAVVAWDNAGRNLYAIGNREGMVLVFDDQGNLKWTRFVPAPVTALCALNERLIVGHEQGIQVLDEHGKPTKAWSTPVSHLSPLDSEQFLTVTLPDQVIIAVELSDRK